MEERKPLAVKNESAAQLYGVSAIVFTLFTAIMIVQVIRQDGFYLFFAVPLLVLAVIDGFIVWTTVLLIRMPVVVIEETEAGLWIMSRRPPLFIAAAEIRGVRVLRARFLATGRHSAPIAIRTGDREVVVYNVENVDGVHDRIVAIMTEAAKNSV